MYESTPPASWQRIFVEPLNSGRIDQNIETAGLTQTVDNQQTEPQSLSPRRLDNEGILH